MTLEITKPADRRYAKVLLFGPAGQGKTHFLGTAQDDPRTYPMLLLDFEGGHETLSGLDIDVVEIRSWEDYNEAFELLSSGDHPYKSVAVDSISETHIWALLEIVKDKGPGRREPDLIEQGDYGIVSTQLRRFLRSFRDLPMHVFFTATAMQAEERGVGRVMKPSMAGKMADEVVALMSVVAYLAQSEDEEGEVQREIILENYPGFRTKVRMPWKVEVPNEVAEPTVTALLDVLQIESAGLPPAEPTEADTEDEAEAEEQDEFTWADFAKMPRKELIAIASEYDIETTATKVSELRIEVATAFDAQPKE